MRSTAVLENPCNEYSYFIHKFFKENQSIIIGASASLSSIPILNGISQLVINLLKSAGRSCNKSQDVVFLFRKIGESSLNPILRRL